MEEPHLPHHQLQRQVGLPHEAGCAPAVSCQAPSRQRPLVLPPPIRQAQVQVCGCIVGPDISSCWSLLSGARAKFPSSWTPPFPKCLVHQDVSAASVRDYLYVNCFVADPKFSIWSPPSASTAAATSVYSSVADSNTRRSKKPNINVYLILYYYAPRFNILYLSFSFGAFFLLVGFVLLQLLYPLTNLTISIGK